MLHIYVDVAINSNFSLLYDTCYYNFYRFYIFVIDFTPFSRKIQGCPLTNNKKEGALHSKSGP